MNRIIFQPDQLRHKRNFRNRMPWGTGLFGDWMLELGILPVPPMGEMYDIEQPVILPLQDAEFMGRGTRFFLVIQNWWAF